MISLALLSGEHNQHLAHIEKSLDVTLDSFGNSIKISGAVNATKTARNAIENLYKTILEHVAMRTGMALINLWLTTR